MDYSIYFDTMLNMTGLLIQHLIPVSAVWLGPFLGGVGVENASTHNICCGYSKESISILLSTKNMLKLMDKEIIKILLS